MRSLFIPALFALLAAVLTGCEVNLSVVPVGDDRTDPGADGSDADGQIDPDEPDAAGTDSGADAGPAEPMLPSLREDFETSEVLSSGGWSDASPEHQHAEVWEGRLCLEPGEATTVAVSPGAYGYMSVMIAGSRGLVVRAKSEAGDLFTLNWGPTVSAHDGTVFGTPWMVSYGYLEVDLSYQDRRLSMLIDSYEGGGSHDLPFEENAGSQLVGLRFEAPTTNDGPTCFDNLYVAGGRPDRNPFEDSPPPLGCLPESDSISRCVASRCCAELRQAHYGFCVSGDDCSMNPTQCVNSCLRDHPSGTVAGCEQVCSDQLRHGINLDLIQCADAECPAERVDPEIRTILHQVQPDRQAAPVDERLFLTWHESLLPSEEQSLELRVAALADASGARDRTLAEIAAAGVPQHVALWSNSNHSRVFVYVVPELGVPKLYSLYDGTLRSLTFPDPIITVKPSPTRTFVWVETQGPGADFKTKYFLTSDGQLLDILRTDLSDASEPVYSDGETMAGFPARRDEVNQQTFGFTMQLHDGGGGQQYYYSDPQEALRGFRLIAASEVHMAFVDFGAAQDTYLWLQETGGGYYTSETIDSRWFDPYALAGGQLLRPDNQGFEVLANLPAHFTAEDFEIPRSANPLGVLYADEASLTIASTDGSVMATHIPEHHSWAFYEPALNDVFPCGPLHGLFIAGDATYVDMGRWTVEAFAYDGELEVTRLAFLNNAGPGSLDLEHQIGREPHVRPDTCAMLYNTTSEDGFSITGLGLYDPITGERSQRDLPWPGKRSAWADYGKVRPDGALMVP